MTTTDPRHRAERDPWWWMPGAPLAVIGLALATTLIAAGLR